MYKKKFYQANEWIKSLANVFSKEIPLISQLNWHSEIGLEDEEFFSNYPNMDIFVLIELSHLSHMLIKLDCNTLLHLSQVKTFSYSANLETVNLN